MFIKKWLEISSIVEEHEQKYNPKICDKCFQESDFVPSNDQRKYINKLINLIINLIFIFGVPTKS